MDGGMVWVGKIIVYFEETVGEWVIGGIGSTSLE
jgi:hypothetical protein